MFIKIAKIRANRKKNEGELFFNNQDGKSIPNYLKSPIMDSLMSTNPERAVSYVLSKFVTQYMDKDVLILSPNTQTRDAARLLRRYETDDIIITDKDKFPIGIVTDQDILSKVIDVTVFAESTTLKEVMTTPLITINEKATLQDALHKMRDNDIRKLPVISKKNKVIGIIYQTTIANVIRNATVTSPRLLSPPVKAVLGNLGFVLQFAGVLLMVPAIVATVLEDTVIATGIYLTTVLLLITGFFLNSYGEKSSLNLQQASILVFASLFLLSLFGTIPYLYVFPNNENSAEVFANAFFSSAAGFTTGGISLFDEPENLSQSFTFFRSFTQLVGGMSFIYLSNYSILSRIKTTIHAWFHIRKNTSHEGAFPDHYSYFFNLHCNCCNLIVFHGGKRHTG